MTLTLPTRIEATMTPGGRVVYVKHEEDISEVIPNGKLRGVLPLMTALHAKRPAGFVNVGASQSNSHVLAAYVGRELGVPVVCVANTDRLTGPMEAAVAMGAEPHLTKPMHLAPLRAIGRSLADERGLTLLPWAFASGDVVDGISRAVDETTEAEYGAMIVPVGGGGYCAAVYEGVRRLRLPTLVIGVPTLDGADPARKRVTALLTNPPDERLQIIERPTMRAATPWPSDPHYEWWAWAAADAVAATLAKRSIASGFRDSPHVLVWSVGRPVA